MVFTFEFEFFCQACQFDYFQKVPFVRYVFQQKNTGFSTQEAFNNYVDKKMWVGGQYLKS